MKGTMKRILACILVTVLLAGGLQAAAAAEEEKQYTVMFYICGADLERDYQVFSWALGEILASKYNRKEINVIGLMGGCPVWKGNAFSPKVLSVVDIGGRRPTTVEEMPLAAMSDPATLTAYLAYCREHYPAKHNILIMCDHGGGPLIGCITDYLFDKTTMSVSGLKQALAESPFGEDGLDIIAFDCCLMGSAEIASTLSPYAQYMIGTEDAMYGMYQDWLSGLENSGSVLETAGRIAKSIYDYNKMRIEYGNEKELNSVSVIDLKKMKDVTAAMDDYFTAMPGLDAETFTRASNHRRDAVTFGVLESGGSSQFDLVDAGSLVEQLEGENPDGEALLEAIRNAIPIRYTDVENCLGMTVYHPYLNQRMAEKYIDVYAGLDFSPAYLNYIINYISIMTGQPLANWEKLLTGTPASQKDNRTLFTLTLTEEQAAHLGQASLAVFLKDAEGGYRLTYRTADTAPAGTTVTGEFTGTALYAADQDGNALTGPLAYRAGSGGTWLIPAELTRTTEDGTSTIQGLICCTMDAKTGEIIPGKVAVPDEETGMISVNMAPLFTDFSGITIRTPIRRETRDEAGSLLPYDRWEQTREETWTSAIDGSWSFRIMNDTLDPENLYAAFDVQDSQGNRYMSEPRAVKGGPAAAAEIRTSYDDAGLVRIGELTVSVLNDITLSMTVTNLSDTEAVIALENLAVNGIPAEQTAEAVGTGPNWGLLKDEEQILSVLIPKETLDGQESITAMTFDLTLKDAKDGTVLGTVPAEAELKLELNP